MRYKAFISYCHRDEDWARWLHRTLESFKPPKALGDVGRLKPIFRDRDELSTSTDLSATILEALEGAEHLIVICSPAAAQSRWVDEEIRAFRALGRESIHCLVVDGDPAVAIPPAILEAAEPLAADPRPGADGKRPAFLKLASTLLGVSYDELRQRDAQLRQRRLTMIAIAAVAGMALTGGLAALAFIGQQQAEVERVRAVQALEDAARARDEAQHQAKIASAINAFLNNDLLLAATPERLGRDVTVREVVERASALVEERFEDEPLIQAELRNSLGTTHLGLGNGDAAIEEFRFALALRKEHAEPDSELLQNSYGNLATALSDFGYFDEAIELSETAVADAGRSGADPSHLLALHEMAGNVYWYAKRFEQAERHYKTSIAIAEESTEDTTSAFRSMNGLALIYSEERRFSEAELMLRRLSGALTESVGEAHPDRLSVLGNLAVILGQMSRWEESADVFEEIIRLERGVYGEDHPKLAFDMQNYASVLESLGRFDEAESLLEQAMSIIRRQPAEHTYLINILDTLSGVYRQQGRYPEAIGASAEALERSIEVYGENSTDTFRLANRHAGNLIRAERNEDAEVLLVEWVARARQVLPAQHYLLGVLLVTRGTNLGFLGEFRTGEPLALEGIGYLEKGIGPDHEVTLAYLGDLVRFYGLAGDEERVDHWQGVISTRRAVDTEASC